ncbi:MAG: Cof-type HAD-IIB family hydrolase [Christensenellales bacterium]
MQVDLLIADIDDTLTDETLRISDRLSESFAAARERGVITTLASGRMFPAMEPFCRRLGITAPVLACQGAAIADPVSGEILETTAIPLDLAREVLAFTEERGLYTQYYAPKEYYFREHCVRSEAYGALAMHRGCPVGKSLIQALDFDPLKVLVIADPEEIRRLLPVAREKWAGRLEVSVSKPMYLEINHPAATKADGLRKLAGRLHIPLSRIMAFGDGLNDIPMLRAAGYGIAVANAAAETRAAAWAVTASQSKDGVAQAIEKYLLED